MPLDPTYKPYKQTGNISVDMVAGCINFYHVQGRKLKVIRLNAMHWTMFKGFVMEMLPTFTIDDNEIDFDGVIITRANILSNAPISWEFMPVEKKKIFLMN